MALAWPSRWVDEITKAAPALFTEVKKIADKFKTGETVTSDENKRLFTLNYHFITINVERNKFNESTRRLCDEYIKLMLTVQKQYIQNDASYSSMCNLFNVQRGFERTPLPPLEEYERQVAAQSARLATSTSQGISEVTAGLARSRPTEEDC